MYLALILEQLITWIFQVNFTDCIFQTYLSLFLRYLTTLEQNIMFGTSFSQCREICNLRNALKHSGDYIVYLEFIAQCMYMFCRIVTANIDYIPTQH